MEIRLDWLGCATFRLTLGETVVFLDAYMDRVPTAPKIGLSAKDVRRADFVLVGHAHFDHIAGAELIARTNGPEWRPARASARPSAAAPKRATAPRTT